MIGKLGYAAMILSALALALTGIGTFVIGKAPMTHWVLMAHASAAPLFAIGLAVVALTWSERAAKGCDCACSCGSAMFWATLVFGLVVILSGVVPMTPIFGTKGQHALYLTHRYGAILLAFTMLTHAVSFVRGRK